MAGKVIDVTLRLKDQMTRPLNALSGRLQDNNKQWQKAGRQIQNAGRSISRVGSTMTKTVTAPIVGMGVASVKVASDFEAGMSKVQSIAGTSGGEMKKLSDKALEMGSKTKFSATEASDAFSYMAMAGWKTDDMLNGIEGTMYLAGATGEDLASVSDIVTDSLTAFGMSAKETNNFVNVLAKTASNSNTNVGLMGETFKYVAPVAGALKFNVQDTATAIGLMANSGIKASNAGTALRSWMTRMANPTKESSTAMEKLGISLTDSQGNMKDFQTIMEETRKGFSGLSEAEKAQYASMLAGKTGMSGLLAIVNSSDQDFNKLSESIYNADGACKQMYDTAQNNLNGQLTVLKSTVESIGIAFGQRMTPYVKKLTGFVQGLADKFNSLNDNQKDTIVKVGLVLASIGPALLIFGKVTTGIGGVIRNVGKFGQAIKRAGGLFSLITSPAGIVIGVLAGIALVTVLVIKNWDKIKPIVQKVVTAVTPLVKKMGEAFRAVFGYVIARIRDLISRVQPLSPIFQTVFGAIGDTVRIWMGTIKTVVGNVLTILGGVCDFITGVFTGNWGKAWEGVKSIFSGVFNSLIAIAKAPLNAVISLINRAISGLNTVRIPDWVPAVGGRGINIPLIPQLAKGTNNWKGGIVQISERGGEIVDLPQGSRVYPHDQSVKKAFKDGQKSGLSINIPKLADTLIVREEADIDRIVQRLADKLEKVAQNTGGGDIGYIY